MPAILGQSVLDGTTIDDWILGVVACVVALTTIAALAHKPPVRQVVQLIGWVFGRLVGEPIAAWYERNFRAHAEPIVEQAVARAVEPLRDELRTHVREEAQAEADLARWCAGVDTALTNLQQAQVPHLGPRASAPDPIKEP